MLSGERGVFPWFCLSVTSPNCYVDKNSYCCAKTRIFASEIFHETFQYFKRILEIFQTTSYCIHIA